MKTRMAKSFGLAIVLALCLNFPGCPKSVKTDKAKAAAYGIQKAVDGSKDTLALLQSANRLPPDDIITLATGLKAVNQANNTLIDAAWDAGENPNETKKQRLARAVPQLQEAINNFVNSGAVVKNRQSQAEIGALADELLKHLKVILDATQ